MVLADSRKKNQLKALQPLIAEACREKTERDRRRGILNRPVRAMVAGIPNVGKSTFINSYAGRACAKTGNRPGVTKGKQWIRLNRSLELLDTPGILWPKFEDQTVGQNLALIGSVRDETPSYGGAGAAPDPPAAGAGIPGILAARYGLDRGADGSAGPGGHCR